MPVGFASFGVDSSVTALRLVPAGREVETITCVVADDHPIVVEAICAVLAVHDIEVVGCAGDGEEALMEIGKHKPSVALLDLGLPYMNGIKVARLACRSNPETAVILFTGLREHVYLTEALDAGARGFVLKASPLSDLVRAVEIAARGGIYIDPVLAGDLVSVRATTELTQREREVLRLLADGCTCEEIGRQLCLSPHTVQTHVRKAIARMKVGTRTEAVATALRERLIA